MYTDDLVHEYEIYGITYRSEAMMNTFLFTGKYLPLPHPTSSPTEPGDKFWRNRSTTGHGWWWMRVSWYLWCTHDGSVVVRTKTDLVSSQRKVPCYLLVYFMHIVLLVSFLIMGSSHVSVALWCNLGGGRWWPNEEWDEVVLPPVTCVNYTGFFLRFGNDPCFGRPSRGSGVFWVSGLLIADYL